MCVRIALRSHMDETVCDVCELVGERDLDKTPPYAKTTPRKIAPEKPTKGMSTVHN